jgi:hypothetical protein
MKLARIAHYYLKGLFARRQTSYWLPQESTPKQTSYWLPQESTLPAPFPSYNAVEAWQGRSKGMQMYAPLRFFCLRTKAFAAGCGGGALLEMTTSPVSASKWHCMPAGCGIQALGLLLLLLLLQLLQLS